MPNQPLLLCGKCCGAGVVRRHMADDIECTFCHGRGAFTVSEQRVLVPVEQPATPISEPSRTLLREIRDRVEEGAIYGAMLKALGLQLEQHPSANVRDMGHEGFRRAASCVQSSAAALREAAAHILQAEEWDAQEKGKQNSET